MKTRAMVKVGGVLERYVKAMISNHTTICIRIEQEHDLFGYPPEIVSVGLKAVDEGLDPHEAIAAYMGEAHG